MRKNMLMLLAAALLVVTGCKKDDKDINANGERMTFTASINNGNDKTSITFDSGNGYLSWTENDAVNINGKGFTAKNVDGEGKATFEGEAVTPDGGKYKAIFPANLYQSGSYVLPATQTYAADNNLSGVNPMYAESETTELTFQSICALMKLTLKGDKTISRIEVSADQALSGPFTIEDNVAKLSSKAGAGVTLDCGTDGIQLIPDGVDFFIAIPEGNYTNLTFKAYATDYSAGSYLAGAVTVTANSYYTSEQTLTFKDPDYLCLTAGEKVSKVWFTNDDEWYGDKDLEYYRSSDPEAGWQNWEGNIDLYPHESVYFRGNNPNGFNNENTRYNIAVYRGEAAASGNIMSLISKDCSATAIPCDYCFANLFMNSEKLTTAPKLPATTLAPHCYDNMFLDCGLTTAPELPATTLAPYCYAGMFNSCWELTTAPELSATTLAPYCCEEMFHTCWELTTAIGLSATTLVEGCYRGMFGECWNLQSITMLATHGFDTSDCLKYWLENAGGQEPTLWTKFDSENVPDALLNNLPGNWTLKKIGSK